MTGNKKKIPKTDYKICRRLRPAYKKIVFSLKCLGAGGNQEWPLMARLRYLHLGICMIYPIQNSNQINFQNAMAVLIVNLLNKAAPIWRGYMTICQNDH